MESWVVVDRIGSIAGIIGATIAIAALPKFWIAVRATRQWARLSWKWIPAGWTVLLFGQAVAMLFGFSAAIGFIDSLLNRMAFAFQRLGAAPPTSLWIGFGLLGLSLGFLMIPLRLMSIRSRMLSCRLSPVMLRIAKQRNGSNSHALQVQKLMKDVGWNPIADYLGAGGGAVIGLAFLLFSGASRFGPPPTFGAESRIVALVFFLPQLAAAVFVPMAVARESELAARNVHMTALFWTNLVRCYLEPLVALGAMAFSPSFFPLPLILGYFLPLWISIHIYRKSGPSIPAHVRRKWQIE